jgi:hypothetical protein
MIREMAAAVPDRDDRGHGSACARAVDASISRNVGTSTTARTPSACVWCGAGRRRSGRPGGGRMKRSRPSTPRPSGRAVSVPRLRRKHLNLRKLRRRVVTQQKFFRRLFCATGQDAMNRRRSWGATRHATAALLAGRRFAGCWIANASGNSAALSEASAHVSGNIRRPGHDAAPSKTTRPTRHRHDRRLCERTSLRSGRAGRRSMACRQKAA